MVKNAGSKNKRGRLMKNMKSPSSGLRWQEISERFETRSIERGITQLHHHYSEGLLAFLFLTGTSS